MLWTESWQQQTELTIKKTSFLCLHMALLEGLKDSEE